MTEFKTKFKIWELYEMTSEDNGKLVGKSVNKGTIERLKNTFEKLYPKKEFKMFLFIR